MCPQRFADFWPAAHNGSKMYRLLRDAVRQRCGLPAANASANGTWRPIVRLLERPPESGRQLEEREALVSMLEQVARSVGATLDFAVARAPGHSLQTAPVVRICALQNHTCLPR